MRKHYILFSCDAWKSYASHKLIGVFTLKELIRIIKRKTKKGDFKFDGINEIGSKTIREIDIALEFGYVEEIQINECLE